MKYLIEVTEQELERCGLIRCECGHLSNNHFKFEEDDNPCAHCDCKGYKPKILIGKLYKTKGEVIKDGEDELEEICGEEYIEAVTDLIHSLLKQQREICAGRYVRADTVEESRQIVKNILNAPEPSEDMKWFSIWEMRAEEYPARSPISWRESPFCSRSSRIFSPTRISCV